MKVSRFYALFGGGGGRWNVKAMVVGRNKGLR